MSEENKPADAKAFENDKFAMDKYSRQIGEFGVAAMAKLVQMKVLIVGLKGVGIEIAKNLVLQGVGEVALYDKDLVRINDLGTNFYLKEEHVGKISRAEASMPQLKSLNPLVKVSLHEGQLTNKTVKRYAVVIDCALSLEEGIKCDQHCRRDKANTKYIRTRVHGLYGYSFSDFGKKFTIVDKSGEQPISRLIESIVSHPENEGELVVNLIAEKPHMMQIDDHTGFINFNEIKGELGEKLNNRKEPYKVHEMQIETTEGRKRNDPYALRVEADLKEKVEYSDGGRMIQVKKPVETSYLSLAESLKKPGAKEMFGYMMDVDTANFGQIGQLHIGLNGIWAFEKENGRLPKPNSEEDAEAVVKFAKEFNENMKKEKETDEKCFSVEEVDEDVVKKMARHAALQFQPLCAFFGGIVAQEVVKYTGKYTPASQWIHVAAFDVLPEQNVDEENEEKFIVSKEDRKPLQTRYDDLIQIIGRPLHQKLMRSSTFMVGCGALGCELLKNFALLGLSCDKDGLITVTDNDNIEISNLSRQFLFRENNVGEPKSLAARNAVLEMNKDINVKALETLVTPASENIFDDGFWNSIDFVTNALDNVKARLYVDSQCVFYEKPLLESGTLGVKCNSQVIIPHLTASYSDGTDTDANDAIPMCTLRNFPTEIEHCIEWSRAKFTDLFETESTKASKFLLDPSGYITEMKSKSGNLNEVSRELESLKKVVQILKTASNSETNFEFCIKEAFAMFHPLFRDNIVSLIKAKPEDCLDDEGQPFWGKVKRFPQVAKFDSENETHLTFALSVANILSLIYGVVGSQKEFVTDINLVKKITANLTPPEEKLEKVDLSEGNTGEEEAAGDNEVKEFESLLSELEEIKDLDNFKDIRIEPASFEKDDDANFHIDFITAASNIRSWNYRMDPAPRHKCKMIAGKIIPAIATTTAAVTGLVCIEMLKLLQPGKKLAAFKDSSNSLGVNNYVLMEPPEAIKAKDEHDHIVMSEVKCLPSGFTKWQKTLIEGKDLTVKQFLEEFTKVAQKEHDKELFITMLLHPYGNSKGMQGSGKFMYIEGEEKYEPNMDRSLVELVRELHGDSAIGNNKVRLDISVRDADENMYKLPKLVYIFK